MCAGIIILIGIYWFLGGLGLRASSYPIYAIFPNAQKLDKGAVVRMAGVKIGVVSRMGLTSNDKARVDMVIFEDFRIPSDSLARITTGGFIGDSYIEIGPGKSSTFLTGGQQIRSAVLLTPDQLMEQVAGLLSDLKVSTHRINQVLGDKKLLTSIKETVSSLQDVARSATELTTAATTMVKQMSPDVRRTFSNLAQATAGAARVSEQIEDMVASDVRPNIREIMRQANSSVVRLDSVITQAQQLLAAVNGNTGKIDKTMTSLSNAADQTDQMMTNLNDAAAGIKDIATDKEIKADLKTAVKNAADASCQLKVLMTNVNRRFGGGGTWIDPARKTAVPDNGISADGLWNTAQGNYRFDANYTSLLPSSNDAFFRIGAYNIGENTRFNLQGGRLLDLRDSVRYGSYASRIGVGYDRHLSGSTLFSADLFRPDAPEMEVRTIFGITSSLGFYVGSPDLFHEDNRNLMLGIQYHNQ